MGTELTGPVEFRNVKGTFPPDELWNTATEYAFAGLPESVPAGTTLSLVNGGQEPHELVAIRIPDEETCPVSELVTLPEEELGAVFGG